jgi:hypothetical protein
VKIGGRDLRAPRFAGAQQGARHVPAEEASARHDRVRLGRPHRIPRAGPEGVRKRIQKKGIDMHYSQLPGCEVVPDLPEGPDDVTIELNFLGEAVDPAKWSGKGSPPR